MDILKMDLNQAKEDGQIIINNYKKEKLKMVI